MSSASRSSKKAQRRAELKRILFTDSDMVETGEAAEEEVDEG